MHDRRARIVPGLMSAVQAALSQGDATIGIDPHSAARRALLCGAVRSNS
jgi:hypothetical protein